MSNEINELAERLFSRNFSNKSIDLIKTNKQPVHVVYGGANLFKSNTPQKLGNLALKTLETYTGDFVLFAKALWLRGADTLPEFEDVIRDLENFLVEDPKKVKGDNYNAWFAWTIFNKTIEKLKNEPIEDYRIDFEDGYGIRKDEEEDFHCLQASEQLAISSKRSGDKTLFCGFRIKSFQPETQKRAVRTLDLFLTNLIKQMNGKIPENFVVTLPKVRFKEEVEILDKLISEIERKNNLPSQVIKIEILIETPEAIMNMRDLVLAGKGRCIAAHFGAFDYTSSFGITSTHQHLRHDACNFARNMMQVSLTPLGIRLSDSVTTEMPIPIYRGENLSREQISENKKAVQTGLRLHFNNVTHSLINGFYQSWDLHPAQLIARYAAVYSFFLEAKDEQAKRLRNFLEKATQAMTNGNLFDDLASAEGLLNFFVRGISCGAFKEKDIAEEIGLTIEELETGSFVEIMENRFEKN